MKAAILNNKEPKSRLDSNIKKETLQPKVEII